jgi:hypothetical protein
MPVCRSLKAGTAQQERLGQPMNMKRNAPHAKFVMIMVAETAL